MRIGLSIGVEGSSRRRSRGERRGNSNNLPGGEKGSDSYESHDASPSSGCVCLPACEFFFCFQFLCVCVCFKLLRRCRGHKSPCPYLRPLGGGGGFAHPIISRGRRKNPRGNTSRRALIFISSPVSAAFSRSYSASVLVISTRVRETRAGASWGCCCSAGKEGQASASDAKPARACVRASSESAGAKRRRGGVRRASRGRWQRQGFLW